MKIKFLILLMLLIKSAISNDLADFPLWKKYKSQNWTLVEGINENILYPSVLPFRASVVARVQFPRSTILEEESQGDGDQVIKVKYYNLKNREFRTTAEVMDFLRDSRNANLIEIGRGEINSENHPDQGILISQQIFADTLWSCGQGIPNLPSDQGYFKYFVESSAYPFDSTTSRGVYQSRFTETTFTKPSCYAKRAKRPIDEENYAFCTGGSETNKTCFRSFSIGEGFADFCIGQYCFEGFEPHPIIEEMRYWQVHLYAKLVFNCRDPDTGEPNETRPGCIMTFAEAVAQKQASLKSADDYDMRFFRNPIMNTKESVTFSFSFLANDDPIEWQLQVDNTDQGAPFEFSHSPKVLYREDPAKPYDWIAQTIYPTYAKTNEERDKQLRVDIRCHSWLTRDRENAKIFFPDKINYKGELVWERDKDINFGDYIYGGCPIRWNPTLGMTLSQAKAYFYQEIPTCETDDILKAYRFLESTYNLMGSQDKVKFQEKMDMIWEYYQSRINIDGYDQNAQLMEARNCPESWVDQLPSPWN